MADKKKIATAAVAVTAAAALLLGGTFAWQSISQTALNEASDIVNPGGRLHDDFDGTNKDVYVENFTDPENGGEDIYARIRLEEYFEIVMNYGTPAQSVETVVGSQKTEDIDPSVTGANIVYDDDNNPLYERVYETKIIESVDENGVVNAAVVGGTYAEDADEGTTGYSWWNWQTGGETVYMPTFNLNKDSLAADLNGKFDGAVGVITDRDDDQYTDYVDYSLAENSSKTGTEIYDGDSNSLDEVGTDVANAANYPDNVELVENQEHTAATTTYSGALMSMQEWIDAGSQPGPYWVYDTDGWVYWAQAIPAGETTGLLLDGIGLNQVMDDTWYYAINVVAQFVTADDVGKADNTGFYVDDDLDGNPDSAPSTNAEALLEKIGVDVSGEAAETPDDDELTKEEADYSITDEDNNVTYYKFSDRPALSNGGYTFTLENIPEDTISFWNKSVNMPYGFNYQSLEAWFSVGGASTDGEEMYITAYTIDDEEYATIYFSYDDGDTRSLEITSAYDFDTWDIANQLGGGIPFYAKLDGEYLMETTGLEATVYAADNPDKPICTVNDQEIKGYYGEFYIDLDDAGVKFEEENTELTAIVTYTDENGTVIGNEIGLTFFKRMVYLTEAGSEYSITANQCVFIEVEGIDSLTAVYSTENSLVDVMTITKDGKDVEFTPSSNFDENASPGSEDYMVGLSMVNIRYNSGFVRFAPRDFGTFVITVTIDGTEYSTTVTVAGE